MSSINDLKYNLPLQINFNIQNLDKLTSLRSRDMPKQLKNDIYRQNQRPNQNINRADEIIIAKQIFSNEDKALFQEQPVLTKEKHKNNTHLRDLIKKKLLDAQITQERTINDKIKITNPKISKENKSKQQIHNRYQSILNQFYGNPNKNNIKNERQVTKNHQKSQKQQSLRKYKSMKKLNQIEPNSKKPTLSKHHSQVSLYTKSPINSEYQHPPSAIKDNYPSKKLTYLDIYMQKKRLYL